LLQGIVKWFSESKNYGFITPAEGGEDVFVHGSDVRDRSRLLEQGDTVWFEVVNGSRGRHAKEVTREGPDGRLPPIEVEIPSAGYLTVEKVGHRVILQAFTRGVRPGSSAVLTLHDGDERVVLP